MFVRLLGEVEIRGADGQWESAGPAKRATVLAVLAMAPGQAVTQEQLVDRVWGAEVPGAARSALYSHITRLRRALAPWDAEIRRAAGGYLLDVARDKVDLFVMRELVARGTGPEAPDAAVTMLREAESLWGDAPLATASGDWVDRIRVGLERERVSLAEARFEAELAHGAHTEIVDEVRAAAAAHPESERLTGQLMLALYRCGRQSEALDWYDRVRGRLREDFGLEPAPELRELHRKILHHDAELRPRPEPVRAADPEERSERQLPRQLPAVPGGVVDRTGVAAELDTIAAGAVRHGATPIGLITGMAGVGKTTTALRWAHENAETFRDGQLFADLGGFSGTDPRTPAEVLAGFLMALGMPGKDVPADPAARVDAYRSRSATRELLVVLDNAATADQVRPLVPAGSGSLVLVTSRNSLSGLVAVEGANRVGLEPLDQATAAEVLARQLGPHRTGAEPAAAAALVEVCGRLPLALRIAAAILVDRPDQPIAELVSELAEGERVDGLAVPDDATAAVRVAFSHSMSRLGEFTRQVFATLGLLPGPTVTAPAMAAMLGTTTARTAAALRELAAAHLAHTAGPQRFGQHDLLKEYARQQADPASRSELVDRLSDWYVHTARHASETISATSVQLSAPEPDASLQLPEFAGPSEAMSWVESELDNLMAVVADAGRRERPAAWLLPEAMRLYFVRRMEIPAWLLAATTGMRVAQSIGDGSAIAAMHYQLALHAKITGDGDAAIERLGQALAAAEAVGDRSHAATAHASLADGHYRHGRLELAIDHSRRVLALEPLPQRQLMIALNVLGGASRELGDLDQARKALLRNVSMLRGGGDHKLVPTLDGLALVHMDAGDFDLALEASLEAVALAQEVGLFDRATTLTTLGKIRMAMKDPQAAREAALAALDLVADPALVLFRSPVLALLALCDDSDPESSLRYASEAVELAEELDLPWAHTVALLAISTVRLRSGELDAATETVEAALRRAKRYRFLMMEAVSMTVLAEISAARGDRVDAVSRLREVLPLHREAGHRARLADVRSRLTKLGG